MAQNNLEFSCHAAGVSLVLNGETIPSDSFVDLDDTCMWTFEGGSPSNDNSDGVLLCTTDLIGCCASPARGDWYFPNGRRVKEPSLIIFGSTGFVVNRGASDQQTSTSGSVRLFRRFSDAPERGRGHFRFELPSAADPNTSMLTLFVIEATIHNESMIIIIIIIIIIIESCHNTTVQDGCV